MAGRRKRKGGAPPPAPPRGIAGAFAVLWGNPERSAEYQRIKNEAEASARRSRAAIEAWDRRKLADRKKVLRGRLTEKRRRQERVRSGLRWRAGLILRDLLDRIERPEWPILTERDSDQTAHAVAEGEPFMPDPPLDVNYDRVVRAMAPQRATGRYFEASVRVAHFEGGRRGVIWEHLVSLTQDPHGLILSFDAKWEKLPERIPQRDSESDAPVIALDVFVVEHKPKNTAEKKT